MRDSLGDRMKIYEKVSRAYLTRRTPVIIRLDIAHAHTFTKKFERPFDRIFMHIMQETMEKLCKTVQNCVLGYTQSDEITLVLCDYKNKDTAAWFDNQVQKICSTSAALATLYFNQLFDRYIDNLGDALTWEDYEIYNNAIVFGATFDSRCFNLPKEEVCNCLIWRQQDATRNSIQMLAHSLFSHKELQGLSCKELQDKMMLEKGVNWNDLEIPKKRGTCCVKIDGKWVVDYEIPIFTQDRDYIEKRIRFED